MRAWIFALALFCLSGLAVSAAAQETKIRVGAIDAVLTIPPDVERPPVALLIAGSGSTDHDGNGPQVKPATLKKLSEQLVARKIATLRYDKRGAVASSTKSLKRKSSGRPNSGFHPPAPRLS
jgi:hypothetical protein